MDVNDLPRNDPNLTDTRSHDAPSERLAEATRHWLASQSTPSGAEETLQVGNESGFLYDQCLAIVERTLIAQILQQCHGNRAAVAARLGMHRTTLRQKMKRYGLQ
jgi:DNA-binding NtrC family response regulator